MRDNDKGRWLYIIENPAFPGFYKIGISTNCKKRLQVYQTSDPYRSYSVKFKLFHPFGVLSEKKITEAIKMFSLETKGEWHKIDLKIAISRLEEQLDDYYNFPSEWK